MSAPLIVPPPPPGCARVRLVTQQGDIISSIIEIGTRGWMDHAESVMPDGSIIAAHAESGVGRHPADYDTASTAQQFIDVPMSPPMLAAWQAYLESRIGAKYDMGAIVGFVTGLDRFHINTDYICSALTILSFRHCGAIPHPLAELAHRISPRDVALVLSSWPDAVVHPVEYRSQEKAA